MPWDTFFLLNGKWKHLFEMASGYWNEMTWLETKHELERKCTANNQFYAPPVCIQERRSISNILESIGNDATKYTKL